MVPAGFSGCYVAVVTPMLSDGSIDWPAWVRLVEFHAANGTAGLVVGGTTGESPTITELELAELVLQAKSLAAGRLQIIAGAGTNSTASTVAKVQELSALQPDGLLLVTPAYNRPTQEGLYQHYAAAAAAATVPLMLYNVPGRTAVDLLPETVARLAQLPRIVAIKEAVASLSASGGAAAARQLLLRGYCNIAILQYYYTCPAGGSIAIDSSCCFVNYCCNNIKTTRSALKAHNS